MLGKDRAQTKQERFTEINARHRFQKKRIVRADPQPMVTIVFPRALYVRERQRENRTRKIY
ncbi:hypothetical protein [Commensalibacter sp. Nvir]|uniref:hypothetical protein n=1 Tax=Commensalibacter sp. Nvir TaxID=3069817 RepID=UPI0030C7F6CE